MLWWTSIETQVQWWFLCSAKVASSQHPLHDILPYPEVCLVQWYFKGVDMTSWAEETKTNLISISITWKSMVLVVYYHIWLPYIYQVTNAAFNLFKYSWNVWKRSKHLWEVLLVLRKLVNRTNFKITLLSNLIVIKLVMNNLQCCLPWFGRI